MIKIEKSEKGFLFAWIIMLIICIIAFGMGEVITAMIGLCTLVCFGYLGFDKVYQHE